MNWNVVWSPTAENELAALWMNPVLRSPLTAAARQFDVRLARDAVNEGESRSAGQRVAFETPFGILFHVDEPNRLVTVIHIWSFAK